jgi:spore coat polysaccharide biosynthesis protein SpsF (cytidylyltransferase family)
MSRTIAIIQVRMNSERLPGKAVMPVAGLPLLQMVVTRVRRAQAVERVVVATSTSASDDTIAALCEEIGVACIRGSESDVLDRFAQTLMRFPATAVVRICADNPFTDPALVDDLIRQYHRGNFDYAYNNLPDCGYPDGVGAEIVGAEVLLRLSEAALEPQDREHVTLHLKRHPKKYQILMAAAPSHLHRPEIRLDIDYPEDLRSVRALCEALPIQGLPYWPTAEIISAADKHPEVLRLRKQRAN